MPGRGQDEGEREDEGDSAPVRRDSIEVGQADGR